MTENQFSTKAMQWFVRKSALEIGSITFTMIRKTCNKTLRGIHLYIFHILAILISTVTFYARKEVSNVHLN